MGSNSHGQLGINSQIPQTNTPMQIDNITNITSISAGWSHSVAITGIFNNQIQTKSTHGDHHLKGN